MKKAGYRAGGYAELKEAVETLAKDMEKLRRYVKMAKRAFAENLSGHIYS